MTTLRERIETTLPIAEAFAYVADFANSREDPASRVPSDSIPAPSPWARVTGSASGWADAAPMEYEVAVLDVPRRVVLVGSGSGVSAVDDVRFETTAAGTRIEYTADIRLGGWKRLVQPLLGASFRKIGREAADGSRRTPPSAGARGAAKDAA